MFFCGYMHGNTVTSAEYELVLSEERDAHAKTKKALEAALAAGMGWKAALSACRRRLRPTDL